MNILCRGDTPDGFTSVASVDENNHLLVTFEGYLRTDNPYRYLLAYMQELARVLPQQSITHVTLDFVRCRYAEDNCLYVLMDIIDIIYQLLPCPVIVRRLKGDEWHQETLPILLNLIDDHIAQRTSFENVQLEQKPS